MSVVLRLLLDSNVVDAAVADPELRRILIETVHSGVSHLLITHVQVDEILDTPDERRNRSDLLRVLAELPAERIPTYGFIVGLSRLDNARLVDDDGARFINVLRGDSPRRTKDAVLIATARFEEATFVSCDRQAVNTAKRNGVPAITPTDLLGLLQTD